MTIQEVKTQTGSVEFHCETFEEAQAQMSILSLAMASLPQLYPYGVVVIGPSDPQHHYDYPASQAEGPYTIRHFSYMATA